MGVSPDTATLTLELDMVTVTTWARDLPMLNPKLKLKLMLNPVMDTTAMDMVMDTDMVITDTDTAMVDITAKDLPNPVMVMAVMPTILMVEAHTLDVPSGV